MRTIIVIFAFIFVVHGRSTDEFSRLWRRDEAKKEITNITDNVEIDVDEANILINSRVIRSTTAQKSPELLITTEGYPVESHYVYTSDGYILNILRIPSGKDHPSNGKVVFLQHGLLAACTDWILFGKERGLAYRLADKGFDVWLGNNRGNVYSKKHTDLDPDKNASYWNFSWHEIGIIDIPTMIDFILKKTNKKKLYHVGHSQGTTSFYVMASTRPEYNDKIIHHISLAPIGFMSGIKGLVKYAQDIIPKAFIKIIGDDDEFLRSEGVLQKCIKYIFKGTLGQDFVKNTLFFVTGFNEEQIDNNTIGRIIEYYPAGASTKQILHYNQVYKSGKFAQYDHGSEENKNRYKQNSPPNYNLSAITTPITLIYSDNDWLSAPKDVDKLATKLPNSKKYRVPDPKWNHIDYLFGKNASALVYNKVVEILLSV